MKQKRRTTRSKRSTGRTVLMRLGLAALSRMRLPLWAKIALGIAALGTAGYSSGATDKLGIDGLLRRKRMP